MMRLQKYLAAAGVCSRRKGEEYISQGLVSVNGAIVTTPGTKIDASKDSVRFRGRPVQLQTKYVYIALNKPVGVISSCSHGKEKIVLDLISVPERIFPVGRLDKDSQGLLLMTNDGPLHNVLTHPAYQHEKEYLVKVATPISSGALEQMARGIQLEEGLTRPCVIQRVSDTSFNIILKEGKNRQIRRMVEAVDNKVIFLKRFRFAGIHLKNLAKGQWRYLSDAEIATLKKT